MKNSIEFSPLCEGDAEDGGGSFDWNLCRVRDTLRLMGQEKGNIKMCPVEREGSIVARLLETISKDLSRIYKSP